MKVSASLIKSFMNCPRSGKFRYVDRLPELQNAAASFGSAVHLALELYNTTFDVEQAKAAFLEIWNNPAKYGIEPQVYPPRTSFSQYKERGLLFIQNYHENNQWVDKEIIATEHRFCVNLGDHQVSGIVDILETLKGSTELLVVDLKTGQRPNARNLGFDVQFCADSETQILTRRGWKDYCEVIEGEDVLTYNAETDLAEWQPALAVNVFDAVDQELISIEGLSHSSLTTKNHRWYVNHTISSRGGWRKEKRVVTSDTLTSRDSIPCGRRVSNLPDNTKYDDDFVALVGWFWTEGHVVAGGSLSLAQKGGSDYQDIYHTLENLWGPPAECMRNGGQSLPFPAWRVALADDANRFYLNRTASLELYVAFEDLHDKVLSADFITSLTEDQLRLFIDVSIRADGHKGPTGVRTITQSIRSRLDAFAIACQLAGIRTSLSHRKLGGKGAYADSDIWTLVLKEGRQNFTPSKQKQSLVSYTGKVWCPTTANGTWLARRNGTVYFTGNTSYLYAVTQKEFWCGYEPEIEKYSGFENGEELYERFKNYTHVGVWYDLKNTKEYPVAPRTEDDYQKLARCIDEIAKAIEHDVFVPNISGDTCGICSFTDLCPVYSPPTGKAQDGLL